MFKKTTNIRGLIGCLCYGSGDWLNNNGFTQDAITICEALFGSFSGRI